LPASFRLVAGSLPPGLQLWGDGAPAAQLNGTPAKAGVYSFRIEATDAFGHSASRTYTVTIHSKLVLPGGGLGNAYEGRFFSATVSASGGVPPYTYKADFGGGLTVDGASGAVSGVVSAIFVCSTPVSVTDATGATVIAEYGIGGYDANGGGPYVVAGCPPFDPLEFGFVRRIAPLGEVVPRNATSSFVTVHPVTLTGLRLSTVTGVTFAGTRAAFTIDSPTKITAYPSVGTRSGTLDIRLANGLQRRVGMFKVLQSPTRTTTLSPRASQ
jgi:hypothetical protein